MTTYTYAVEGRAANAQTWQTEGDLVTQREGAFPEAVLEALKMSFNDLTQGKAVYGQPGVGCSGPYTITKLTVTRKETGNDLQGSRDL
jgi:hypothetical protein